MRTASVPVFSLLYPKVRARLTEESPDLVKGGSSFLMVTSRNPTDQGSTKTLHSNVSASYWKGTLGREAGWSEQSHQPAPEALTRAGKVELTSQPGKLPPRSHCRRRVAKGWGKETAGGVPFCLRGLWMSSWPAGRHMGRAGCKWGLEQGQTRICQHCSLTRHLTCP